MSEKIKRALGNKEASVFIILIVVMIIVLIVMMLFNSAPGAIELRSRMKEKFRKNKNREALGDGYA